MNRLTVPTLAAATAIAVAAAGCGSSHSSASKTATAAAAPAASATSGAPAVLLGTYTRFVTKADIARTRKIRNEAGPNQQSPKPAVTKMIIGQGMITITTAGLRVTQDYSATAAGGLDIKGYRNPQVGSFCGPDVPQNATYTWKQSGAGLALHASADKCADRDSTMTGTWKKR
jgi:hypothetical protein